VLQNSEDFMALGNRFTQALQRLDELHQHANETGVKQLALAMKNALEDIRDELKRIAQGETPRR
jgi:hypothetical protein